jgi:hypothetical protein
MLAAKSLYWGTLGMLALTFLSSHEPGIQSRLQAVANDVCVRTAPLRAMAELSWGRTQSDISRAQAIQARVAAEQARLEAQQVRLQALTEFKVRQTMVANKMWDARRAMQVERALRKSGIPATLDCPQSQVNFEMPVVSEHMNLSQDPI